MKWLHANQDPLSDENQITVVRYFSFYHWLKYDDLNLCGAYICRGSYRNRVSNYQTIPMKAQKESCI